MCPFAASPTSPNALPSLYHFYRLCPIISSGDTAVIHSFAALLRTHFTLRLNERYFNVNLGNTPSKSARFNVERVMAITRAVIGIGKTKAKSLNVSKATTSNGSCGEEVDALVDMARVRNGNIQH